MRVEKAAVCFDKIFHLMCLLCFSVIRRNFGIFVVLFNGGVLLLVEWTYTDPFFNNMKRLTKSFDVFQVSDRRACYKLNKSENATPELFAIYMQNDPIQ